MPRAAVADRAIGVAERVAGGFLAAVTALTFVAVVLRYVFSRAIPDSYDFSRNFLGILIFWGIAVTSYRGDHITVDLLYGAMPRAGRRALDLLGDLFTFGCMAMFAWAMGTKVLGVRASHEETFDLHLPVWPFYALAWLGIAMAVVFMAIRIVRRLRGAAPDQPMLLLNE